MKRNDEQNWRSEAKLDLHSQSDADEGSLWELFAFAIFFVVIFSAIARAEASPSKSRTEMRTTSPSTRKTIGDSLSEKPFSFHGSFTISTYQSLDPDEPTAYSGGFGLTLGTGYKPWATNINLVLSHEENYSYAKDDGSTGTFGDPILTISRSFALKSESGPRILDSINLGLYGSVPGSHDSSKRSYQGAIGPFVGVSRDFDRFNLSGQVRYLHSAYEYEVAENGSVNTANSTRFKIDGSFSFTDAFSAAVGFAYTYALSFEGVGKATQVTSAGLYYSVTKALSIGGGVSMLRGTLDPDGHERLRVFDPRVSSASLDLMLKF